MVTIALSTDPSGFEFTLEIRMGQPVPTLQCCQRRGYDPHDRCARIRMGKAGQNNLPMGRAAGKPRISFSLADRACGGWVAGRQAR